MDTRLELASSKFYILLPFHYNLSDTFSLWYMMARHPCNLTHKNQCNGIMRHINVTLYSQCLVIMNKTVSYISTIKEESTDIGRDNCCPSFNKVFKALSFQLQNPFCLLSWSLLLPSPLSYGTTFRWGSLLHCLWHFPFSAFEPVYDSDCSNTKCC